MSTKDGRCGSAVLRSRTRKAGCAWTGRPARRPTITNKRMNRQAGLVLMEAPWKRSILSAPCTCDFRGKISSRQGEMERRGQEDRHLAAGDRLVGAGVAAAAAAGDAVRRELLDPAARSAVPRHGGSSAPINASCR